MNDNNRKSPKSAKNPISTPIVVGIILFLPVGIRMGEVVAGWIFGTPISPGSRIEAAGFLIGLILTAGFAFVCISAAKREAKTGR